MQDNQGKIKPAMSYEFFEEADELEPQAGSSRSGGPPRKTTLAGVLNPQNCPRCGRGGFSAKKKKSPGGKPHLLTFFFSFFFPSFGGFACGFFPWQFFFFFGQHAPPPARVVGCI